MTQQAKRSPPRLVLGVDCTRYRKRQIALIVAVLLCGAAPVAVVRWSYLRDKQPTSQIDDLDLNLEALEALTVNEDGELVIGDSVKEASE